MEAGTEEERQAEREGKMGSEEENTGFQSQGPNDL